jgi:hypothetical protein
MTIEDVRSEVLNILKEKDITGRELLKELIVPQKDKVKALGFERYDMENPASMGNFVAKEIMPKLGVPVYKEKINVRGNKRTLYSLNPNEKRVLVN